MTAIDIVVLSREARPLRRPVAEALHRQRSVELIVHRVVGGPRASDSCRWETIARARNEGKTKGRSPWLMFLDDDVVLHYRCVRTLLRSLCARPAYGGTAADYLAQSTGPHIAPHVAMGATLFRREVVQQVRFRWQPGRCECQCCCDDLRRMHWGIDYCPEAVAEHLPNSVAATTVAPTR